MDGGIYLIIMPPDKKYFQILVDKNDQHFTVISDYKSTIEKLRVKGSKENTLFYDYLNYLNSKRPEADSLRKVLADLKKDDKAGRDAINKKLDDIDKSVTEYQEMVVQKNPNTFVAQIVRASKEVKVPEFRDKDGKEDSNAKYFYFREHYFDNIDPNDSRMQRTPLLFGKIDYYMNKLVPQHPDSIGQHLDRIFEMTKKNDDTYRYYFVHYLNAFAKSEIVGMDGVYVHLAKNYIEKGKAAFIGKEDSIKIVENGKALEPILIGKTAPDLKPLLKIDSSGYSTLHSIQSPWVLVYFWHPECSHCKKTTPFILKFYEKYKDKGLELCAICTDAGGEAMKKCVEAAKEKGLYNIKYSFTDPYIFSKYKTLYDIKATPQIFILDKKKEIVMKRIAGEQLEEVFPKILNFHKQDQ